MSLEQILKCLAQRHRFRDTPSVFPNQDDKMAKQAKRNKLDLNAKNCRESGEEQNRVCVGGQAAVILSKFVD